VSRHDLVLWLSGHSLACLALRPARHHQRLFPLLDPRVHLDGDYLECSRESSYRSICHSPSSPCCVSKSVVLLSSMLWRTFYSESPNPILVSVAYRDAILTDNTKAVVSRLDWGLQSQTANYAQQMRCSTPNRRSVLISTYIYLFHTELRPTNRLSAVGETTSKPIATPQVSIASCILATKPVRHQPVPRDKLLVDGISGRPRRGSTWRVSRVQ
jgi:hypothetical protein